MKKLLILLTLLFGVTLGFSANINEAKTDIYFGNGVFDDEEDSKYNRDRLEKFILKNIYNNNLEKFKTLHYTKREDIDERNKDAIILLSFNWDKGTMDNLYEMFLQLKQTGQLDEEIKFFEVSYELLKAYTTKKLPEKLQKNNLKRC